MNEDLTDMMDHSKFLETQAERPNEQIITLNNISLKNDSYSVCGMETSIPSDYFEPLRDEKGNLRYDGKGKEIHPKPEIDMVVINPDKKELILVEYKCTNTAVENEKTGVEEHLSDYIKILEKSEEIGLVKEMLKAYYVMKWQASGEKPAELKTIVNMKKTDLSDYKIGILFLFTQSGKNDDKITEKDVRKTLELIKDKKNIKCCYIEKPEDVSFDDICGDFFTDGKKCSCGETFCKICGCK